MSWLSRIVAISSTAVLLTACAAGGPAGKQVLSAKISPSKARIVMYRLSPIGFAIQPDYTINGHAIAPSQPSGFIVCEVRPGNYAVAVANVAGDQSIFSAGSEKAQVRVASGETAYFLAQPQMGVVIGFLTISQVSKAQGRKDTASLSQISGTCP